MKIPTIILVSALVLLAAAGTASAEEAETAGTGVITNVWFCKMTKTGDTYEFDPLPTLYTGTNDYGRLTFITGTDDLAPGDYAVVQVTDDGLELIESLTMTKQGTAQPEYVVLGLELREEQLIEPLEILGAPGTTAAETTPPSATAAADTTEPVPAATKSPVSLPAILAGLGIAGILCAVRMRREFF